ncbi:acyl-CoA-binding domain-containing protein 5A isoform X2 [Mastacembelus armatus]|uniref:Acyl-CoA-binding domain-containing protein 5 n=1 Tax=Mastacembelus armatus TaxID=205130 RepID=A0A3Q3LR18_9TELE|nr:acyl-CoA-binding domain-containing protein 5 isoform X2 [Mastacembelus armatus]
MEVDNVKVDDERRLTELRFQAAVKVIKSLPPDGPFQPSNDMMLKFYSYYKQATLGACNIQRPHFWDAVGRAKWEAWNSLGDMPKEAAMAAYVDEVKLILEGMPMTDQVEELLRVLGPFYELVEEKKKITQISDLSTEFGTMMNLMPSKSIAKSIVRTMEMEGTLETRPPKLQSKEMRERSEEDEDDEEEEEVATGEETKASQIYCNGVSHLINGSHSRAAPNTVNIQEDSVSELVHSGYHADSSVDGSGPNNLASDSDNEIYCDSVDHFGQEEFLENNHSHNDMDEDYDLLQPLEELHILPENQEDVQGPVKVIKCGEDEETDGIASHRQNLDAEMIYSVRRTRGSRSPSHQSLGPIHSSEDGNGNNWDGAATSRGSLNEQIVVVLARVQEDMQSILQTLRNLEALTASQARSVELSSTHTSPPANKRNQKPSWWPFDISPLSLAFTVTWPFVLQWLICQHLQRRRHTN